MSRSLAYKPENALNAICPYFTMFPLEYPLNVLQKYKGDTPVVMDPFCGRGTTLFAARRLGFESHGVDSSPVAVAVAKAKLAEVNPGKILALATRLISTKRIISAPDSTFFEKAFHPTVLRDLCALRGGLLSLRNETDESVVLRATILGCLHGPMSKSVNKQSYFSNQMPRTFSAKPDYAIRFWSERALCAPKIDVISVLKRKLDRIGLQEGIGPSEFKNVNLGDSRFANSLPRRARNFSVVVTSPPYYGMKTYVEDQWLRNWFLGGSDFVPYRVYDQIDHAGKVAFTESLGSVWKNMARSNADSLDMHIRFGIIPSARVDAKEIVRASLESSGERWREVSVRGASTASAGKRQAEQMNADSDAVTEYDFHVTRY